MIPPEYEMNVYDLFDSEWNLVGTYASRKYAERMAFDLEYVQKKWTKYKVYVR